MLLVVCNFKFRSVHTHLLLEQLALDMSSIKGEWMVEQMNLYSQMSLEILLAL